MVKSLTETLQLVLLVSVDTLRQDHVGCYGYRRNTTPFIDSLAAQGRHYTHAFTPVPVTLPAHASIFTARYPGWSGVGVHNGTWLPPSSTWVTRLNAAGITTAGFVSSFVLDKRITRGFDLTYYDDTMTLTELNRSDLRRRGETTVRACLDWFASAPKDAPIFCFVHLMDVHGTYDVPGPIGSQFVQQDYDEDSLPICEILSPGGIPDIFRLDQLPDFPGRQVGSYYVDRYDGCIAYVDQQIQRLISGLAGMFGTRFTAIIVSDHGEAFGEDNYWCTHSHGVLPNQTQVPFIIWSNQPESLAGLIDPSKPTSLLDIGPTVLELFRAAPDPKERCHGWSLFDHARNWDTRHLFSISLTQILAYDEKRNEGAVIGEQTKAASFVPTINTEQRRAYFDAGASPAEDSVSEAFLFYTLAKSIGSKVKPISVTSFERQEEQVIAKRLADLGYVDSVPSGTDTNDIDRYVVPLPAPRGEVDWKLPRPKAEMLARELQIRPALDLGCGAIKTPGFWGVDRFPLPGVDLESDLDAPLPFTDNSIDLVFAGHAVEHVQNLTEVMKEIYRVCRHGAQVCIVAPYISQGINFANPYHRQGFNEHTPRFWTPSPQTLIERVEYDHPHAASWGLSQSDGSDPGIDFRCLRMEFFYFPEYRNLPPEEQRAARKKYLDVCDQIMYHLLVVKQPMSEVDMQELAKRIEYYDPPYVAIRRLQERLDRLEAESTQVRSTLSSREAELEQVRAALAAREKEWEQVRTLLASREAELEQTRTASQSREAELEQARTALQSHAQELERVRSRGKSIACELDAFRQRHVVRWLNRFLDRSDLSNDISPAFQQLKDDSYIFNGGLHGFRLKPSLNLQLVPFLAYPLDLDRPNLAGILLAPIMDFPAQNGVLGIEIVSPANTIVVQSVIPMHQINEAVPTRFDFAPIPNSSWGRFWLRVFAREVEAPVRVFEWRKYTALGLGPVQTGAFCGFVFH